MSATPPLTQLLQELSDSLGFSAPVRSVSGPDTQTTAVWHNWVGHFQPDRAYAIALLDNTNAAAAHALISKVRTTPIPEYMIFCEGLGCTQDLQHILLKKGVCLIHSPRTARTVERQLLAALLTTQEVILQHGVLLQIHGLGVLLRGASGTGKSSLALTLLERGHALIADDNCWCYRMPARPQVYGVCPPMLYDLLHIDELGVLNIAKLFGPTAGAACTGLDLVITLNPGYRVAATDYMQIPPAHYRVLELDIPEYTFRPRHTENMALLVETAVKNQLLYRDGYDANTDLAQRQRHYLKDL